MKNIIAFLLYCLSITAVVGQVTGDTHFQATPASPGETVLDLELKGVRQTEVVTARGRAVVLSMEGGTPLLQAGAPDVPKYATTLMIPAAGNMEVEVLEATYRDMEGVEVAPSKGDLKRNQDPARIPYTYGGAYARDAFFPENLVELQRPFILRDARGQAVWLQPVQYNPVQKILRVYSRLRVRVRAAGGSGVNEMRSPAPPPPSRIFRQMQQKLFANYDPALLHQANSTAARGGEQPERLLVIAKEEFVEGLQPLLDWKRQMGVHTTLVTHADIGGSDPATVQA
ncbi:MAG TPA: C25 family peptidase propeptide domain-containing protein, partial [Saprospiraceae bacterium]|nr:C25 family peptidase propeptide domain-containing protein [Saprospiraceae bacterium]